jgi:hypothetical protein
MSSKLFLKEIFYFEMNSNMHSCFFCCLKLDNRVNLFLHYAGHLYSCYKANEVTNALRIWDELMSAQFEDQNMSKIASTIQIFTREAAIPLLEDTHSRIKKYILETGKSRMPLFSSAKRVATTSPTADGKKVKLESEESRGAPSSLKSTSLKTIINFNKRADPPVDLDEVHEEDVEYVHADELKFTQICQRCLGDVNTDALIFKCHSSHVLHSGCTFCNLCRRSSKLEFGQLTLNHLCVLCRKLVDKYTNASIFECCAGHVAHVKCVKCILCTN